MTGMFMAIDLQALLVRLRGLVDEFILAKAPDFLSSLLLAAIILFASQWIASSSSKIVLAGLRRARIDETLAKFLSRIAQAMIMIVGGIAALERMGVNTTSVSAMLAAAGLAVAMALQGSLSNFAAGVIIMVFRPFRVGDLVEVHGTKGLVEEVHIFNTVLRSFDNVRIIVPNSSVTTTTIQNFSAEPHRRIDLIVGCGYNDDILAVKQFLIELVNSDQRILPQPPPIVAVNELGDHAVNFVVRPWVATNNYHLVKWDLLEAIKVGFDARGFHIPFPQRDVHVYHEAI
ncbi:MAG: mechanosensitive ion channel, partial [Planctomycetales bacterium]|nr:mechanosensitive ion channel [Planctomycetales bacterium]